MVSFDANNNPAGTSYTVEISTDPTFVSIVNSSVTLLTRATFDGLAPNTTYYLQALATNFAGISSAFTSLGSTVTATVEPPSAGTILAASTSTITAAWDPSTGATSYTLVASTTSTNPPTSITASSSTALSTATVSEPRSEHDLLLTRECLCVGCLLKLHRARLNDHARQCTGTA